MEGIVFLVFTVNQFTSGKQFYCSPIKEVDRVTVLSVVAAISVCLFVLTDLETSTRRVVIKRGEYSGKLKQAMSTLQLPLYDIIVGTLAKLDEYRISISSEGAECAMIMHRQLSDWGTFLQTCGVDALAGRLCTFTHCRFLKMKPPVLLPTPLACFQLRMSDAVDSYVVQDVCLPSHEHFYATHCYHEQQQYPHNYSQAPLSVCVPDNNETFIILVEVLGISDVSPYSVHSSGSTAGCTSTFRVVTLLVRSYGAAGVSTSMSGREWIEQQSESLMNGNSNSNSSSGSGSGSGFGFRVVHLILLDDQVHLSDLWSVHDLLLVYRPFIRDNAEERLYGGRAACDSYTSMGGVEVVTRPDISLSEYYPPVVHSQPSLVLPYHFLYGSVTLVSKVIRDTTAAVLVSTVAPVVVSSSSGSTATMPNQNQKQVQAQPQHNNSGGLRVGEVNASATGRVVGIYLLPVVLSLPETTATATQQQSSLSERNRASYTNSSSNSNSSTATQSSNAVFYVTELWIDPLASSVGTNGTNGGDVYSQLLRIRFQCSELPSRSPHLAAKVSQWLQSIRDTGRAHPLHSTAFEYGHKVFSIGHLVHFTDLHVLDACEVVESYNPTPHHPMAHNHPAAAMTSGTVPSQVQRTPHAPQNAPLNAVLSAPSTQLAPVAAASQSHKPSMFLKSAMGRQEPGPLAILMYIKNNYVGGGGYGNGGSGGATLLTVPATHVLNCTVGSSIKHLYLFPVHSATLQMQLTQHTQHTQQLHTQQSQHNSVPSSGPVISNPPIVLPLDFQLGAHSSLYSSGAAAPLMLNVSKMTALTGSPSLYMPHSVAELAVTDSTHRTGNNCDSGIRRQVTVSCVFVVASICKLGDGVRLYHPASNNKHHVNNGHTSGHNNGHNNIGHNNNGHDSIGGGQSVRHETCYQLVRLRDVNGHELICLIDGTVTTNNCANGHGCSYSSGSNSNSGHGASPLKKPRTTFDHTQPQPGLSANNSGNSDINGYTTQVFTHNVINITSSIYFDSSNGSIILPSTTSNTSAGNRSVESNSSKLFSFILSRIEDVAPMAPKNSNNNGKPPLVPKFRIEVMNEVNLRGLEAEEQRQKQATAATAAVTMTV